MRLYSLPAKSGILFLMLLLLSLGGCDKSDVNPVGKNELIVGRWQLRQTSGGLAGGTYPANSAHPQEMVLAADGQAQFLIDGTATAVATYTITRGVSLLTQKPVDILLFSGTGSVPAPEKLVIESVSAEDLYLSDDSFDGFGYHYRRR